MHANRRATVAVLVSLGLSACATFAGSGGGLDQVDGLVERIDRVQTEAETSKNVMIQTLDSFHAVVAPNLGTDAEATYEAFLEAVDRSRDQADALEDSLEPMVGAADEVFSAWAADLDAFTNPGLRERSRRRLEETRARFDSVLSSAQNALAGYRAYNALLEDYGLYFGHDFNTTAVKELEGDVRELAERAAELGQRFDQCRAAAAAYMRAATDGRTAPPGGVVTSSGS